MNAAAKDAVARKRAKHLSALGRASHRKVESRPGAQSRHSERGHTPTA
jgi:hypothetical protein